MITKSLELVVSLDSSAFPSVLSFDIGGSHVSAAVCKLRDLKVVRAAKAPLAPDLSCLEFLDVLHAAATGVMLDSSETVGAVLAFPGPFDFVAGVSRMKHKLKSLYGMDLRSALATRFDWSPERFCFVHDAGAFLLGEVHRGAARGAAKAIGIVLGTGIGSAFALNGRWMTEGKGVPSGGEIWNLPYGKGIVEDLVSTRAIKAAYVARSGLDEEVATIASRVGSDPNALAAFQTFGSNLGCVFRDLLAPFDPDVIVLGGGISRSAQLFLPFVQNQLNGLRLKLVTSSLRDKAPLVGAAAFWRNGHDSSPEVAVHVPEVDGSLTDDS